MARGTDGNSVGPQQQAMAGQGGLDLSQREKITLMLLLMGLLLVVAGALTVVSGFSAGHFNPGSADCASYPFLSEQYSCIYDKANATGNLSMCSMLTSNQRYSCVENVAKNYRNISACSLINITYPEYYSCVMTIIPLTGTNYSLCQAMHSPEDLYCMYTFLARLNFSSQQGCMSISNTTISAQCASIYYFENAVRHSDPSYCYSLASSENRTLLYAVEQYYSPINSSAGAGNMTVSALAAAQLNMSPRQYCQYRLGVCKLSYSQVSGVTCS